MGERIAAVSGLYALAGYAAFSHYSGEVIAATTAVAAGAVLAMLADTMVPEAFEEAHDLAGLITGRCREKYILTQKVTGDSFSGGDLKERSDEPCLSHRIAAG